MQKRVILQKSNPQGGNRPLMKWLMWAALALVILVAVTPLINRQKNHKELSRKPVMEKGSLIKEVPKVTDSSSSSLQIHESTGAKAVRGAVPGIESTPVPRESSGPADEGVVTSARDRSMVEDDESPMKGQGWVEVKPPEPAVKPLLEGTEPRAAAKPQPMKPEAEPVTAVKQPIPATKPVVQPVLKEAKKQKTASLAPQTERTGDKINRQGQNATATKPAIERGKVAYCVQVGSFKQKRNAEVLQQHLQQRGYSVNMTARIHPKLGQIYVVQLQAVDDLSKASTLMEQIRHEEKVKPVILKVPKE